MKKTINLLLICLVCIIPQFALAMTGMSFETFERNYAENITFINDNTGRHILPLVFASADGENTDGKKRYAILGDVLSMDLRTDVGGGVIEFLQIILRAPRFMEYGDPAHSDFMTAGFHAYALLMAMHSSSDPALRYGLVTSIETNMQGGDSDYITQLGVYSLLCTKANAEAVFTFENSNLTTQPSADEEENDTEESKTEEEKSVAG